MGAIRLWLTARGSVAAGRDHRAQPTVTPGARLLILAFCVVAGAIWGGYLARKRGGTRADIAQYAAGFAIAFAIAGLFVTLILGRLG